MMSALFGYIDPSVRAGRQRSCVLVLEGGPEASQGILGSEAGQVGRSVLPDVHDHQYLLGWML